MEKRRWRDMNKKRIAIISVICVVIIGGIVGVVCYRNRPEYVVKEYIKLINNGNFNKLKNYEYNYEDYEIASSIDNLINKGISEESIKQATHIDKYDIHDDKNTIQQWTGDLYIYLMDFNVGENYKNISKIRVFQFYPGFNSSDQKYGGYNNIVVGKVHGKWKVVYSPFYYLK
jgi:hypothetical protein